MAEKKSLIVPMTFVASVVALPASQANATTEEDEAPKVLQVISRDEAAPVHERGSDRLSGLSAPSARLILVEGIGGGH